MLDPRTFRHVQTLVEITEREDGRFLVAVDRARHIYAATRSEAENVESAIRYAESNAIRTLQAILCRLLGVPR